MHTLPRGQEINPRKIHFEGAVIPFDRNRYIGQVWLCLSCLQGLTWYHYLGALRLYHSLPVDAM